MKKIVLLALVSLTMYSCKNDKSSEEVATANLPIEVEVKKDFKIKSVTRKDYLAEYKFGEYTKGKQLNKVVRKFNEQSLPYEIEIEIIDPDDKVMISGDSLSTDPLNDNVFKYTPKKNGYKVEMYGIDGELAEILIHKGNTMYGYTADNDKEPFIIREFDALGNYNYQVINTGDEFLYVTRYAIVDIDENGFAKKSNAMWFQYKKRADINYNNIDFSSLEVIDKNYQVAEFNFELY